MKIMKNKLIIIGLFLGLITSCSDYLDVIPDNVATLDIAFNNRASAERYLVTCYSYVPLYGDQDWNPGLAAGNDVWYYTMKDNSIENVWSFGIANGLQNIVSPLNNYWDGENQARPLFKAIRDCNIFLEYVSDRSKVAGLDESERKRWLAEVNILKAFYHYYLFQLYGPIPVTDTNLPIDASPEEVRVTRQKVDDVVNYIVDLIDGSYKDLPLVIQRELAELGRLTQAAALSIKAKTLVLAASPLFNGNTDYANFRDHDGSPFFNQTYQADKWTRAAEACREAIESAEMGQNCVLYDFARYSSVKLPDSLLYGMNVRQAVTERFNQELVWSIGKQSTYDLQCASMAKLNPGTTGAEPGPLMVSTQSYFAPTLLTAEMFYSANGVPIEEDKEWLSNDWYSQRYKTRTSTAAEKYYIKGNYETAILHFNREPRFYGSLGFDGSTWYGNGWTLPNDDNTRNYVEAKKNQYAGQGSLSYYSITGYFSKKLVYYKNSISSTVSIQEYAFPMIRLADLYLMYAEALNEATSGETVNDEVYTYLDKVRNRSGLKGVKESWAAYSTSPDKPASKSGMREIVRRERQIELALEGQRYFDLRRWKTATRELSRPIQGWTIDQRETKDYYQVRNIHNQRFYPKDYLWPIKEYNITINSNLIQNPGW